MSLVNCYK